VKIVTAITPNLSQKVKTLERSLKKYGADYQVIIHRADQLESFRTDWPQNRPFYCTAQGGEFMKWVNYSGIICFIDADMMLQRVPTPDEYATFLPEKGEFTACSHAYPPVKLFGSSIYKPWGVEAEPSFIEIGAAMLIAHTSDWVKMREYYLHYFELITESMKHHATTQWLISYIIQKHFNLKIGAELLHNASWYRGSRAVYKNRHLEINGELVIFNHHKFHL